MCPTIVRDGNGHSRIVIGAAGGPRIPTSVFIALLSRMEFGMGISDALSFPRFHHQWKPERVSFESGVFSKTILQDLEAMGYSIQESRVTARIHAVERDESGVVWGIADPRGAGVVVAE